MSGIVPGSCNIRIPSYLLFIENLGPAGVTLERVGNQVRYISPSVAGQNYAIDSITPLSQNGTGKKSTSLFSLMETTSSRRTVFGWMG